MDDVGSGGLLDGGGDGLEDGGADGWWVVVIDAGGVSRCGCWWVNKW